MTNTQLLAEFKSSYKGLQTFLQEKLVSQDLKKCGIMRLVGYSSENS